MLIIAAGYDLHSDKIPNRLILYGMVWGSLIRLTADIFSKNTGDIPVLILELFLLFLCLWPVYQAGGLGAGDCKLLLMTGVFLPVKQVLFVLICSLFFAAGGGVLKMLWEKRVKRKQAAGKVHFSIPLLAAVVLECIGKL